MLVSGYRTQFGGVTADSRASGFLVASGAIARTQSEFTDTSASKFFNTESSTGQTSGLRLPADAGQVSISAVTNLVLDGSMLTKHSSSARGAEVNISSENIAISGDGTQEEGYLTLSSDKLNAIGAESLTIGAKTAGTAVGTKLDVVSSNIKLIGGASLNGQEIILAATDTVSMAKGTSVKATGAAVKNSSTLIIGVDEVVKIDEVVADETYGIKGVKAVEAVAAVSGDGALLRVSTGVQRDLVRNNVSKVNGTLDIQSDESTGAKISATGSIIADATHLTTLGKESEIVVGVSVLEEDGVPTGKTTGGAISLGASKISFGAATSVDGLLLDNTKLAALGNPSDIKLKSYSTIDFYGTTEVGTTEIGKDKLKSLTLETSGLKVTTQPVTL